MVLHELGSQLAGSLAKLHRATVVDDELLKSVMKDICTALLHADVNVKLVGKLRNDVMNRVKLEEATSSAANLGKLVERTVVESLIGLLDPGREPYQVKRNRPNVIMFVGLQGAGKTTTVAKYAHHYQQRRYKTAMVCADTFRAGAFDQLKQNALRVKVPFYGSYDETDPVKIASDGVDYFRKEKYEVIIVDTSGRHKQEAALFEEMEQVAAAVQPDEVIFVMDSSIGQAAESQARAFKQSVAVGSVIITKLDGHAKGGGALSAVAATESPITFIGTGEHFEDLEPFDPSGFISKIMGRGDIKALMQKFKDTIDEGQGEEMMKRLGKGKFSYRDLYEQLEQIQKLGPLNKVMEMVPGFANIMSAMPNGADPTARFKRFSFIMDSMTQNELDCQVPLNDSRVARIARGSGSRLEEVLTLIKVHKQFEKVFGKLGKSGLMKGGDANLQKQMQRNPNAVMQQLSKSMNPQMLKQMGGMGNIMNMMKQMTDGGGMGGLSDALGGLGGMFGGGGGQGGMPDLSAAAAAAGLGGGGGGRRKKVIRR